MRRHLTLLVDLVLLPAATLTFASGLVMLVCFHAGDGPHHDAALGVARLVWLDLHRLSAILTAAGIAVHVALNWSAFTARLRRALAPTRARGHGRAELVLYASAAIVVATGFAAWLLVDGSAPLAGPIPPGRLDHGRHALVDLHDLSGLVALALAVHHVGHRWSALWRGLTRLVRTSTAPPSRSSPAREA